jgi:hypothetical protein
VIKVTNEPEERYEADEKAPIKQNSIVLRVSRGGFTSEIDRFTSNVSGSVNQLLTYALYGVIDLYKPKIHYGKEAIFEKPGVEWTFITPACVQ